MYEELIQALRVCGDTETDGCYDCKHKNPCMTCNQLLMMQAADAIDELQKAVNFHKFNSEFWEDKYNSLADEKWIPVTERLPEMGKEVLVSDKQTNVTIAWIVGCISKDGASFEWACSDGWIDDQLPITHWMPLPTPPKEETE